MGLGTSDRENSGNRAPRSAHIKQGHVNGPSTARLKKPVRLNNKFIEGLPPGEMWWDDDRKATGFGVRSYAGGGKSFFIDYRIDGRQRRITIGPFPRWSADAARERAKELRKQIDRGHDPAGAKRERRTAPTVQDLIDRYIADHLPKKSSEATRVADEKKMLAEIGKHLGKYTKVADVHGGDIGEMHRKISESIGRGDKPRLVRANRILTVASKMFSLALVPRAGEKLPWRNAVLGNPCRGIERNREEGRERFFGQAELAAISDALAEYQGVAADCVRLVMLTGCRPAEAMRAEWSEFDERTRLLDQAERTHQAAQGAQAAAEPGGDRADRAVAREAPGVILGFPGRQAGRTSGRALARVAFRTGSAPGSARTHAFTICVTHSRASARVAA